MGHYEYVGPGEGLNARPLRDNADYRRWWLGNLASSTGDQLVMVAFPLMVLLLTKSAFQAGLVASLSALPFIVLSLPVGELVDRISRRLVLIASSTVSLVAHASLAASYWCGVLTAAQLYVVAFINGCAFVVFLIAQQAVLPVIVSTSELPAATSLAETVERLAAILGPPLGTYLFFSSSAATPFAINAVSFAAITLAVARVKAHLGPFPEARSRDHPIALAAGAKTVFSNPLLRDLTLINAAGDLLFAGVGLLIIVRLNELGVQGSSIGVVFSLAAVGGLIGSLITNRLERWIGLPAAVIGKHVLVAALFPLLLLDLPLYGVGIVWAVISFQVSIVGVIQRKAVFRDAPADLMGRVQSFTTLLSWGSLPIGTAATGFLLSSLGGHGTVAVYTGVLVALAVWSIASPPIRRGTHPQAVRDRN
ncbi:MFS transporter [Mycolicibacterium sp. YH-1]|uniref:MFS transporter n=1 Tax=Mycolicibacterium sp. YH-1 TaxID=2908837 RepID=UPI001F4BFAD1|nr:MFS transporter [Mycolicibacterium sp. YH-1]UNB52901.1 MFS transporter [Mycolicibacterium sp. YH-1]